MKVVAEGGELVLQNEHGDTIIIPKNKRDRALNFLKAGNHKGIDRIASKLPSKASYAKGGTVVDGGDKNLLKEVTVYGKKDYKKALEDYNKQVADYEGKLASRDSIQNVRQGLLNSYSKYEKADSMLRSRYVDATKKAASEVWYAGGNNTPADTSHTALISEYGTYNDLIDDTAKKPRKGWYNEKGVQEALNSDKPFIISDYYEVPEYFAIGVNPGALKGIANDPELAERLRFAQLSNKNGALSSVSIPILDMPNKPVLPELPTKPVKPKMPKYNPIYEDVSMKSVWATQVKQSKNPTKEVIGSYAGAADNKYKKGFTYGEALKFPKEIKKKFGIR